MFYLKKYYFDGIDHNGNTFILYYAILKLFGIKIPYSSYLLFTDNESVEKSNLTHSSIGKNNTFFKNNSLKIKGNWTTTEVPFSEILFDNKIGKIRWNCCLPKGSFNTTINGKSFSGLGYSEILEMNFPVWKLPISTLKWGRFLSENHTIIWIEWIGKEPLKKVFWNEKPYPEAEISDKGVHFPLQKAYLKFEKPITIKNEKLLSIADKYPFLKLFFSKNFLNSNETKFVSNSSLLTENQTETGYSLYEIVLWKK